MDYPCSRHSGNLAESVAVRAEQGPQGVGAGEAARAGARRDLPRNFVVAGNHRPFLTLVQIGPEKHIIKGRPFKVGFDRSHQRLQKEAPS
jgi:hypothetical protein